MIANIDRLIVGNEDGLEIKTSNGFAKDQWEDDNIPDMYMAQIQHYMAVTGYEGWYIAVLIGGNHFKYQYIERDDEYIDNLIKIESDFWFNNVVPKIMPDVDGSLASSNLIKRMFSKAIPKTSIPLNGETNDIINKYLDYSELESKYSELKEESVNKIKMMLGENEKGATDNYIVNWKNVNSNRFDSQALKKESPELFKQYSKDSSYRRFSIKSL
jgi:predicted phage-related endonuclease